MTIWGRYAVIITWLDTMLRGSWKGCPAAIIDGPAH
jgi:hypothetical protein